MTTICSRSIDAWVIAWRTAYERYTSDHNSWSADLAALKSRLTDAQTKLKGKLLLATGPSGASWCDNDLCFAGASWSCNLNTLCSAVMKETANDKAVTWVGADQCYTSDSTWFARRARCLPLASSVDSLVSLLRDELIPQKQLAEPVFIPPDPKGMVCTECRNLELQQALTLSNLSTIAEANKKKCASAVPLVGLTSTSLATTVTPGPLVVQNMSTTLAPSTSTTPVPQNASTTPVPVASTTPIPTSSLDFTLKENHTPTFKSNWLLMMVITFLITCAAFLYFARK